MMTQEQRDLLARYAAFDWSLSKAFADARSMAPAEYYAGAARLYENRLQADQTERDELHAMAEGAL